MSAISVLAIFFIIRSLGKAIKINYRKQLQIFYENLDDWFPSLFKRAQSKVVKQSGSAYVSITRIPATEVEKRDLYDATRIV